MALRATIIAYLGGLSRKSGQMWHATALDTGDDVFDIAHPDQAFDHVGHWNRQIAFTQKVRLVALCYFVRRPVAASLSTLIISHSSYTGRPSVLSRQSFRKSTSGGRTAALAQDCADRWLLRSINKPSCSRLCSTPAPIFVNAVKQR